MKRRPASAVLLAAIAPCLWACAGAGTGSNYAVDVRRFESDEQRLDIHNISAVPIQLLQGRNGAAMTIAPNATLMVRFKVQSLESHLRVAGESYYFRTAGPVTNRFQEVDGLNFVQEVTSVPVLFFRDAEGTGEISFDLNSCTEMPPGMTWETMQWGPGNFRLDVPPRTDEIGLPLCPGPTTVPAP
jgi:hypothetical protein